MRGRARRAASRCLSVTGDGRRDGRRPALSWHGRLPVESWKTFFKE